MLSLAIDTSTLWGRFAIASGPELLVYQPHNVAGSYADNLLTVIEEILTRTDCKLADLDALGICHGPGSFTGLRIGVSMAKALAWGLGIPLVAVSTLETMAAAMLQQHPGAEIAVPVLDARRGEIFAGIYHRRDTWVAEDVSPQALAADTWWERILETIEDPGQPVYAGNGVEILLGERANLRSRLLESCEPRLRLWSTAHPATASVLAPAMNDPQLDLGRIHPFALTPLYLRNSEAEIKRGLDLTPLVPQGDIESRCTGSGPETGKRP